MARALVLSGGGVKGAFQAGVIHRLVEAGDGGWDIVCGVSAGALNALLTVQEAHAAMLELWQRQARLGLPAFRTRLDVAFTALHAMAPGVLTYLDVQALDGVYDNRELRELVDPFTAGLAERLSRLNRHLRVGVVCLQTGELITADPASDVVPQEATDLVLASTAIPVAFDPVELTLRREGAACSGRRCQFIDGGARDVTPLRSAEVAASEVGLTLDAIDVVLCSPVAQQSTSHEFHGLLDIGLRAEEILVNEIYRNDLQLFRRDHALETLRRRLASSDTGSGARTDLDLIQAARRSPDPPVPEIRIFRPTNDSWRTFTGREDADVLAEFPEALDRNGELIQLVLGYGRWLAEHLELIEDVAP